MICNSVYLSSNPSKSTTCLGINKILWIYLSLFTNVISVSKLLSFINPINLVNCLLSTIASPLESYTILSPFQPWTRGNRFLFGYFLPDYRIESSIIELWWFLPISLSTYVFPRLGFSIFSLLIFFPNVIDSDFFNPFFWTGLTLYGFYFRFNYLSASFTNLLFTFIFYFCFYYYLGLNSSSY